MAHRANPFHHLFFVKFYGHTATPIHLCIVSGCFCATKAELSSCDRDCMAFKASNSYYLTLYSKDVPTADIEDTEADGAKYIINW